MISGEGSSAVYTVNLDVLTHVVRKRLIESIIEQKFDPLCARIWRLLYIKKYLEQKEIAAFAMIPIKDARERLYKMLTANYVQIQPIPRTADRAPSRTFYLWTVNMENLRLILIEEMYKTIFNCRMRLQHHLKEAEALIAKSEEVQALKVDILTKEEKKGLQTVQHITNLLEFTVLQIDDHLRILQT